MARPRKTKTEQLVKTAKKRGRPKKNSSEQKASTPIDVNLVEDPSWNRDFKADMNELTNLLMKLEKKLKKYHPRAVRIFKWTLSEW